MSASPLHGTPNPGGNPTFYVDQLVGVGQHFSQGVVRLRTIARMYPNQKPREEWARLMGLIQSMTAMLAPPSDTEDPYGGAVPIHRRVEFSDWFGSRPRVADACEQIWDLRTTIFEEMRGMQREARDVIQSPLAGLLAVLTTHFVLLSDALSHSPARVPVPSVAPTGRQSQSHAGDDHLLNP